MKVLHLINWLATGGAEKLIIETIPILSEQKDLKIDLALLDATEYPFYRDFKITNKLSEIFELSKGSVYNPLLIFKIIPLLKKYDIVHVHLFPALYWAAIAKMISFSKTKLIFTEHSTNNRRLSDPKFRFVDKFIYKFYSKIICISPEVKKQIEVMLKIPVNKLEVVTNGIDVEKIGRALPAQRADFNYSNEDVILIMVAGFRIEKDHETLIGAVKELPSNYKLLLVGDGYRRKEIEDFINKIDVVSRVCLAGIRMDVPSLLKMSDVAVLSSHWEGFGLAAAEAMAAGIPVIASNVEGLSQVVDGGGLLFEKGNVEELKNNVLSVTQNKDYYESLVANGRKKVLEYDINELVKKTAGIYQCL